MADLTYDHSDSAGSSDSVLGQIGLPWPTVSVTMSDVVPTTTIDSGLTTEYPGFVRALVTAHALPVSIVDPWITLEAWDTPISVVRANRLNVPDPDAPLGDDFYDPIILSGLSGATTFDIGAFSVQAGEPDAGAVRSVWLQHESYLSGTLRAKFTSATDTALIGGSLHVSLGAYYGDDLDDLEPTGAFPTPAGTPFYELSGWDIAAEVVAGNELRLYVPTGVSESGTVGIEWTFAPTRDLGGEGFAISLAESYITRAPATLRVGVNTPYPDMDVELSIPGTAQSVTVTSDSAGVATGVRLPLPASMSAGTYKVRGVTSVPVGIGSGEFVDEVTFTVAEDPITRPTPPIADDPPTAVFQPPGVRRWVFQDPMPGGLGSYIMPLNPDSMSSPEISSNLTVDRNTAGGYHFWEGTGRGRRWRFSGQAMTLADLQDLLDYTDLRRRIYVIDHHNRAWAVTFEEMRYTPTPKPGVPERHRYEVDCLVYGDGVQL